MPTLNVKEGDKVKLSIPQGTTYVATFNYTDKTGVAIPLTGYTARCQFRGAIDDVTPLYNSETLGDITITPLTGSVVLKIPAAVTTAWTWRSAVYDLELVASDGSVTRLVRGSVRVSPEITR